MSQHAPARWLVTYDIRDPKRLARVFKTLKKEGIPIQYSVFYLHTSSTKINQLMSKLAQLVNIRLDDVRAYRLPERGSEICLGSSILPHDIWNDMESPIEAKPNMLPTDFLISSEPSKKFVNPIANSLQHNIK
jgi:CRISPR-associated protein Cas2